MNILVVADSQRLTIEQSLESISRESGRFWTVTCPRDAQALISVFPVDAVVLEFTFCDESLFREIKLNHPNLPIIAVVDDPFLETFQQLQELETCSSLPVSEVAAQLGDIVQAEVAAGCVRVKSMSYPFDERRFSFELTNDKSKITPTVELLLDAVEAMEVCTIDTRFRLGIALEEALVNAVVHGNLEVSSKLRENCDDSYEKLIAERQQNPRYAVRRVTLTCCINPKSARFTIADQGPGFDVASLPDPTDPDFIERPCGRGLLLMRSFMSEVSYNTKGNEVTMVYKKPIAAPTPKPAPELSTTP